MSKWTQVNSEPITTERRVLVTDGDRTGYAGVHWNNGIASLFPTVYRLLGGYDEDGDERIEILDRRATHE